jgi:glycosyltransferase involved in cell wall biosynthesis
MSNVLLEYMASGKPIVATTVGGNQQLIEHNINGLLVPPKAPSQLADAISALLADPERARRLASAARERAVTWYSREAMVRRFEDFYLNLVGRRGRHVQ